VAIETNGAWIHGVYLNGSPQLVVTAETDAWQRASTMAENTPDAFVLVGNGQSMNPLYSHGTILVVRKTDYSELKLGQTVLYLTKQKKVVAHLLVAKVRDGWRVQGLNNHTHDMEPVSPANFVGVVIAAFRPVATERPIQLVTIR
jgi:signal peptidase I